jgi:hypothetical protein
MMPGISASKSGARQPSTDASRRRDLSELQAMGHWAARLLFRLPGERKVVLTGTRQFQRR